MEDTTGSSRTKDATGGALPNGAPETRPKVATGSTRPKDGTSSTRTKVADEYVRVFELLGISDVQKVQVLARLLHSLWDVSEKLDHHMATTGGAIHVAVSRMCDADNPRAAPQHRWIRLYDRLGFFSDGDEHAGRIVNIGLSYAYRHKEVNSLTAANAVLLRSGSAAPAFDADFMSDGDSGQQPVPEGGVVVSRPTVAPGLSGNLFVEPSTSTQRLDDQYMVSPMPVDEAPPLAGASAKHLELRDLPSEAAAEPVLPEGGVVLQRHSNGIGAIGALDGDVNDGGIVVVTRVLMSHPPGQAPAAKIQASQALNSDYLPEPPGGGREAEAPKVVSNVQPVVVPNAESLKCITAVLQSLADRKDIREVLQQLVIDSLLCLARIKSGSAAGSGFASSSASTEQAWSTVRTILHRWWRVWEVAPDGYMQAPPAGTVAFIAHPTRPILSSRWAINVDMETINPVIQQLEVKSGRYFNKEKLPTLVSVSRFGPNVRGVICLSVATSLLIACKEDLFCTIVSDLVAQGRVPAGKKVPLLAATRHDFETAALDAPEVLVPHVMDQAVDRVVQHNDTTTSVLELPDGLAAGGMEEIPIDDLHKEMDLLLTQEQEQDAAANRALRISLRRRARPADMPSPRTTAVGEENTLGGSSQTAARAPAPLSPTM